MVTREAACEFVKALGYEPSEVERVELDYSGVTVVHADLTVKPLLMITTRHNYEEGTS